MDDVLAQKLMDKKVAINQLQENSMDFVLHLTDTFMANKHIENTDDYFDAYLEVYLEFAMYAKVKLAKVEKTTTNKIEEVQDRRRR